MEIFKIAAVGICGGILAAVLKNSRSEFCIPVSVATGVVIILMIIEYIENTNSKILEIVLRYGIDISYMRIMIKVICIAYICQFACDILRDAGQASVAVKVELAGKLIIFSYAFPIAEALLETAAKILT